MPKYGPKSSYNGIHYIIPVDSAKAIQSLASSWGSSLPNFNNPPTALPSGTVPILNSLNSRNSIEVAKVAQQFGGIANAALKGELGDISGLSKSTTALLKGSAQYAKVPGLSQGIALAEVFLGTKNSIEAVMDLGTSWVGARIGAYYGTKVSKNVTGTVIGGIMGPLIYSKSSQEFQEYTANKSVDLGTAFMRIVLDRVEKGESANKTLKALDKLYAEYDANPVILLDEGLYTDLMDSAYLQYQDIAPVYTGGNLDAWFKAAYDVTLGQMISETGEIPPGIFQVSGRNEFVEKIRQNELDSSMIKKISHVANLYGADLNGADFAAIYTKAHFPNHYFDKASGTWKKHPSGNPNVFKDKEKSTNKLYMEMNKLENDFSKEVNANSSAILHTHGTGDAVAEPLTASTNTDGLTQVGRTQHSPTELASLVNAGFVETNPSFGLKVPSPHYYVTVSGSSSLNTRTTMVADHINMANQGVIFATPSSRVNDAENSTGGISIIGGALAATFNSHINVDPLVLDLDGDSVELLLFGAKETYFDTDNDGYKERTGWVGKDDGILVHDLNGNGKIDDITETVSEYYKAPKGGGTLGGPASNPFKSGFDALKTLDNNGDGVINSADSVWSSLRVWQDTNGDGISHSTGTNPVSELKTLTSLGITEIKLTNKADGTFISGNEVRANGSYTMNGTSKTVASVNFLSNTFGLVEVANPSGVSLAGKTYKVEEVNSSIYTTYAAGNGGESVDLSTSTTYSTYNNIIGGTGADTLKGNSQNSWLVGNTGAKRIQNLSRRQPCATGALPLPLRLAEHPLALAA